MKFNFNRWIPIFVLAVAIIIAYKIINNVEGIVGVIRNGLGMLSPFFGAFAIAYVLNTPCKNLQRLIRKSENRFIQKHARGLSIASVYLLLLFILIIALSFLIPALSRNVIELAASIPAYYDDLIRFLKDQNVEIEQMVGNISLPDILNQLRLLDFNFYLQHFVGVVSGVFSAILAIIASIYMLIDKERLALLGKRLLSVAVKKSVQERTLSDLGKVNEIFLRFLYSQLLDAIIIWILATILLLILRVEYALLLGSLIGVFNMIPYFGSIFSGIITALITVFTGGPAQGVLVAASLLVLQQIDGNIIGPRIVGGALKLRPLTIIIAISIGGKLFGILGMLLAVPAAAMIRIIALEYFGKLEVKRQVQRQASKPEGNKTNVGEKNGKP